MSGSIDWSTVLGIGGPVLVWLLRLENRLGKMLSREEHERMCEARNVATERQLDDIKELLRAQGTDLKEMLKEQNIETARHREKLAEEINTIRTHVTVLRVKAKEVGVGDDVPEGRP